MHLSTSFQASMNESTLISLVFIFGNHPLGSNPKQETNWILLTRLKCLFSLKTEQQDVSTSKNVTLLLQVLLTFVGFFFLHLLFPVVFRHYRLQFSARDIEVQIYYTTLCYFGTKTEYHTRHHDPNQCNNCCCCWGHTEAHAHCHRWKCSAENK